MKIALAFVVAVAAIYTPPRLRDGHPDLQGIWDFRSATPLERPARFAGKEFMTEQEVREYERLALEREDGRPPDDPRGADDQSVHPVWWLDYGKTVIKTHRTSLNCILSSASRSSTTTRSSTASRSMIRRRGAGPGRLPIR